MSLVGTFARLIVIKADVTVAATQGRFPEFDGKRLHLANCSIPLIALSNQSEGVFHEHDTR